MKKELKDYIHYYLGCPLNILTGQYSHYVGAKVTGVHNDLVYFEDQPLGSKEKYYGNCGIDNVQLLLRQLSDMTDEEAIAVAKLGEPLIEYTHEEIDVIRDSYMIQVLWSDDGEPHRFMIQLRKKFLTHQTPIYNYQYITAYLIKQGFDMFDLIEAGLAVEKTILEKENL